MDDEPGDIECSLCRKCNSEKEVSPREEKQMAIDSLCDKKSCEETYNIDWENPDEDDFTEEENKIRVKVMKKFVSGLNTIGEVVMYDREDTEVMENPMNDIRAEEDELTDENFENYKKETEEERKTIRTEKFLAKLNFDEEGNPSLEDDEPTIETDLFVLIQEAQLELLDAQIEAAYAQKNLANAQIGFTAQQSDMLFELLQLVKKNCV